MDAGAAAAADRGAVGVQRLPRRRHRVPDPNGVRLEWTGVEGTVRLELHSERAHRAGPAKPGRTGLAPGEAAERLREVGRRATERFGLLRNPAQGRERGRRERATAPRGGDEHTVDPDGACLLMEGAELGGRALVKRDLEGDVQRLPSRGAGGDERGDGTPGVGDRFPQHSLLDPFADAGDPNEDALEPAIDELVRASGVDACRGGPQGRGALEAVGETNQIREKAVVRAGDELRRQGARPLHDAHDGVVPVVQLGGVRRDGAGGVEVIEANGQPRGTPTDTAARPLLPDSGASADDELFQGLHNPPGGRYDRSMSPHALLIVLLSSCATDPMEQEISAYHDALAPLLAQNVKIAQGFLDVASKVKKGETDAPRIAERLTTELMPIADELRDGAAKIEPVTPQLGEVHTLLVQAWTARSASYHAMSDAWAQNDLVAFEAAKNKNLQSKLDEEKYFQKVNALAQPYGLQIDQYP